MNPQKSETLGALIPALVQVQAALIPVKRESENPFFKSKYADLEQVWDAIREPLTANGFAVSQPLTVLEGGQTGLITLLLHDSGEWISSVMPLLLVKEDPQAQGSAITYARRYALCALVGVVQGDDDGNAATQASATEQAARSSEGDECQVCGKNAVIKGKPEYGGGFVCWKGHKNKGCGAKYRDDGSLIETLNNKEYANEDLAAQGKPSVEQSKAAAKAKPAPTAATSAPKTTAPSKPAAAAPTVDPPLSTTANSPLAGAAGLKEVLAAAVANGWQRTGENSASRELVRMFPHMSGEDIMKVITRTEADQAITWFKANPAPKEAVTV